MSDIASPGALGESGGRNCQDGAAVSLQKQTEGWSIFTQSVVILVLEVRFQIPIR